MARPYLNVTLGVRSCIFLSFESVKTAKKLWRERNTTAEFFILTGAWSKEESGRHTRLPVTQPLLRWSPLVREGRGTPPPRSSFAWKNLASDKLFNTHSYYFSDLNEKNQTGIIPARKDRKISLVCTTTFCEFLLLIRTDKKLKSCTNRRGSVIREPEAITALRIFLKMKMNTARLSKFLKPS
jgi:hypothetical protein